MQGVRFSKANAIITEEWKKVKASNKEMKRYRDLYKEEKLRHEEACRDMRKIIWMKWRLLTFTKGTRPEKPLSLKKHQTHPNQMSLRKGQAMEKGSPERQEKEQLDRPHSLKKHQSQLSLLVIQAMKKKKKSLKKSQAMKKYHTAEKSTKVT